MTEPDDEMEYSSDDDPEAGGPEAAIPAPPVAPPPAPAASPAPPRLMPEQARSEINRIRGDRTHAWHQPGHRQHAEAVAAMERLYAIVYPGKTDDEAFPVAPEGQVALTAAEMLQVPPPPLSAAAQAQGLGWGAKERKRVFVEAEREGLVGFAHKAELLFAELAGQPMPTGQETEDKLYATRGAARVDAENLRVTDAWEWLQKKLPATAARLEKTGLFYHPRAWDLLLALYGAKYDGTTAHGVRRAKERWAAQQAKVGGAP